MIIGKTNEGYKCTYKGRQHYTPDEFATIKLNLISFDAKKVIDNQIEKEKCEVVHHPYNGCCTGIQNNETFPVQAPKKYIYKIPSWKEAKNRQGIPIWTGEVYTRTKKSGRLPSCKTCSKTIRIGTLALRVDISEIRKVATNNYKITVVPHHYCVHIDCLRNKPITDQDPFHNFTFPTVIKSNHISDKNKQILIDALESSDILISD